MKLSGVLPLFLVACTASAFSGFEPSRRARTTTVVAAGSRRALPDTDGASSTSSSSIPTDAPATTDRRALLREGALGLGALIGAAAASPGVASAAAVRAVGSAELTCREEGNCLEKFDLDGAVGWSWGGKERCDASDPLCGPNGKLLDEAPSGEAVPAATEGVVVTNVVEMDLRIGRQESLTMRIGLYGDACPADVKRMLEFTSPDLKGGIDMISKKLLLEDQFYAFSVPVSLNRGGALNVIYPGERLDFGVASQVNAYARSKGLSKAEGFTPQPRPNGDGAGEEVSARPHDAAGLLSVPKNGIGYGGFGLETDDEAYSSAFQITAGPVPGMDDREGRKVIGQLMDQESMAALARLSSLATRKGFKGVIPGQNAGPPLLKVTISGLSVSAAPKA